MALGVRRPIERRVREPRGGCAHDVNLHRDRPVAHHVDVTWGQILSGAVHRHMLESYQVATRRHLGTRNVPVVFTATEVRNS